MAAVIGDICLKRFGRLAEAYELRRVEIEIGGSNFRIVGGR